MKGTRESELNVSASEVNERASRSGGVSREKFLVHSLSNGLLSRDYHFQEMGFVHLAVGNSLVVRHFLNLLFHTMKCLYKRNT